jgi:polar amino acid transport system permease protein
VGVDSTPRDQTPGGLERKASARRVVAPPNTGSTFSTVVSLVGLAVVSWGLFGLWQFHRSLGVVGTRLAIATAVEVLIGGLLVLGVLYPAVRSLRSAALARQQAGENKLYEARATGKVAHDWCLHTVSLSVVVLIVGFVLLAAGNADGRVRKPFLNFRIMDQYFWTTVKYFVTKNLKVALIAFPLVLIWGLVLAIARLAPGRTGRPVRWMATFYIDLFRGIPGLVNMTLIGFGLPLSRLPIVSKFDSEKYAILSLTITYGAYVAEVYRSGIESIHWSQTAASRSLGLSNASTMRYVIVPQAVRRIIPPLLNDFISIQKDTALLSQLGYFEVFSYAKGVNSFEANLSAMTLVALLFYAITIPQARYVDRQLDKEKKRTAGGK